MNTRHTIEKSEECLERALEEMSNDMIAAVQADALCSIAAELQITRQRQMFVLPKGNEVIDLTKVVRAILNRGQWGQEVIVYTQYNGTGMIYEGENGKAVAQALGLDCSDELVDHIEDEDDEGEAPAKAVKEEIPWW